MSKKVEVATIFRLDQTAVDRVRETVGSFVSFDWKRQVFSLSCDDDEAPNAVVGALREIHEDGAKLDLTEEPKMHQLAGTALTNAIQILRERRVSRNQRQGELLTYSDDSSESETEVPNDISHTSLTWKPRSKILPDPAFVGNVLHGLHCIVDRDGQENHLDLRGVHASEALRRLTRVEDLLFLRQAPLRKNLFVLESQQDFHRFETLALRANQQIGERIIAPDYLGPQKLLNKHISRLQIITFEGTQTPLNLTKPERPQLDVRGPEQSSLWLNQKYEQLGTEIPDQSFSGPATKKRSTEGESLEKVEVLREQSRYLSRDKSQLVSKWAGDISPSSTINIVEPPVDSDARKIGKQRRVRDSDDESSSEPDHAPLVVPTSAARMGKNVVRKFGRRRMVKDSDEESDLISEPKRETSSAIATGTNWDLDYFEQRSSEKPEQAPPERVLPKRKDRLIDVESDDQIWQTEIQQPKEPFSDYAKKGLIPLPAEKAAPSWSSQIGVTLESTAVVSKTPSTTSRTPSQQTPGASNSMYVNRNLPVMDMAHIKREKLQALEARVAEKKALKETAEAQGGKGSKSSSERLQKPDEVSSRRYVKTMAQKAGKGRQKLDKAAADQKRQDVLAESWGPSPMEKPSSAPASQEKVSQSPRSSQSAKPTDALHDSNGNSRTDNFNVASATRLSKELLPIFGPLCAYSGHLTFSIQVGQVLISSSHNHRIGDKSVHEFKEWNELFNPIHGQQSPATIFTNHLTTNGKDIDHIVNLQCHERVPHHHDPWANSSAIFNSKPEERETTYEFHCRSKDNESFIIVFTDVGAFRVVKPSVTLGSINLHYVGQVWDARAVVTGTEPFEVSSSLEDAITNLRNSFYIPDERTQLELTYRRPLSPEVRVEKITCTRKTLHDCLRYPGVAIETVQIQDLILQSRSDNPDICRALTKSYASMVTSDRLRWKVSLLSRSISAAFVENESLALGDLVKGWTAEPLLFNNTSEPLGASRGIKHSASNAIKSLTTATNLVMKQIDGVGYYNVGSLCRLAEAHGSGFGSLLYNNGDSVGSQGGDPAKGAIVPNDSASQAGGQELQGGARMRVTYQPGFSLHRVAFRLLASPSASPFIKSRSLSTSRHLLQTPKRYTPISFQRRWASSEAEAKEDLPVSEVEPTPTEEIENAVYEDAAEADTTESVKETPATSEGTTSTTEPEARTSEDTENWNSTDPATTSPTQDPTRTDPDLSHEDKSAFQNAFDSTVNKVQNSATAISDVASKWQNSKPGGGPIPHGFDPKPTIYIGNLFFDVTENDVVKAFSQFGKINKARLVRDARGLSKGFGYIDFETAEAATNAIESMNQKIFEGRRLRCQFAAFTSSSIEERHQRAQKAEPANPPSKTLFIGNMSFEMTDRDLNQLFRSIKNVIDVRVAIDRRSGQPRGFAHADFIDIQSAVEGMEVLKQKEVYGRKLRIDFSVAPNQKSGERKR